MNHVISERFSVPTQRLPDRNCQSSNHVPKQSRAPLRIRNSSSLSRVYLFLLMQFFLNYFILIFPSLIISHKKKFVLRFSISQNIILKKNCIEQVYVYIILDNCKTIQYSVNSPDITFLEMIEIFFSSNSFTLLKVQSFS